MGNITSLTFCHEISTFYCIGNVFEWKEITPINNPVEILIHNFFVFKNTVVSIFNQLL